MAAKQAIASPDKLMAAPTEPSAPLEWRPQLLTERDRERLEDLEQIAWMAAGLRLGATPVARAGTAVDTPAQAAFAAATIARNARRARPKAGR